MKCGLDAECRRQQNWEVFSLAYQSAMELALRPNNKRSNVVFDDEARKTLSWQFKVEEP